MESVTDTVTVNDPAVVPVLTVPEDTLALVVPVTELVSENDILSEVYLVRSMTLPVTPSFKVTFGLKDSLVPIVPPPSKIRIIGLPTRDTLKDRVAVAALQPKLPACFAVMVTLPLPLMFRIEPKTEATLGLLLSKVTGREDEALALRFTVDTLVLVSLISAKVIVWTFLSRLRERLLLADK